MVHAETERVSVDRDLLRTSGELQVDVHALRRRTLGGLVALAAAVRWSARWSQPVAVDAAGAPRPRRRRLRPGAAQGRPPRAAGRPPGGPCRGPRGAARRRQRSSPLQCRGAGARDRRPRPGLPHPSVPLAPVRPVPGGRVVAARTPAPAGWQQSAVVGLDDDDIGFADIDEYQPRRVANALNDPAPRLPPPVLAPGSRDGILSAEGAVAQSGSAPRSHRGGQGFNSPQLHTFTRTTDAVGAPPRRRSSCQRALRKSGARFSTNARTPSRPSGSAADSAISCASSSSCSSRVRIAARRTSARVRTIARTGPAAISWASAMAASPQFVVLDQPADQAEQVRVGGATACRW